MSVALIIRTLTVAAPLGLVLIAAGGCAGNGPGDISGGLIRETGTVMRTGIEETAGTFEIAISTLQGIAMPPSSGCSDMSAAGGPDTAPSDPHLRAMLRALLLRIEAEGLPPPASPVSSVSSISPASSVPSTPHSNAPLSWHYE